MIFYRPCLLFQRAAFCFFILTYVFLDGTRAIHSVKSCLILHTVWHIWRIVCSSTFSKYVCVISVWAMPSKSILPHHFRTFPILAFILQVLAWFVAIWCTVITMWLSFFFDKAIYLAYHVSIWDFKVQVNFIIFNMFSCWVTFVVFNYSNMIQHITKFIDTDY